MQTLQYMIVKVLSKTLFRKNIDYMNQWFRSRGIKLGRGCHIYSNIAKNEPHLINIGNNVTISGEVEFVTHDNSISKVVKDATDLFGKITIGSNCFIGTRAIILYGVTISDNVIVAAGSVVTKSVYQNNVIIAGNPAKIVSTWEQFAMKSQGLKWSLGNTSRFEMIKRTSNGEKLVRR